MKKQMGMQFGKKALVITLAILAFAGGIHRHTCAQATVVAEGTVSDANTNGSFLDAIRSFFGKEKADTTEGFSIPTVNFEDVFTPAEGTTDDSTEPSCTVTITEPKKEDSSAVTPNEKGYREIPSEETADRKALLNAYLQAVINEEPGILLKGNQTNVAFHEFASEIFWLDHFSYLDYDNGDRIVVFTYKNCLKDRASMQAEIDSVVEGLRKNGILSGSSAEEILRKIHDYLCRNLTYNQEQAGEHIRDIYGALVEGDVVCVGYAYAFAYLCKQAGIPCDSVMGDNMEHMWNVVTLDGEKAYCVDVTWDDTDQTDVFGNAYICYDNFLISNSDLEKNSEDHLARAGQPYETFREENGYWERNGFKQPYFTVEGIRNVFAAQYALGYNVLSIRYTNAEAFAQACSYLYDHERQGTWDTLRLIGQLYDGEYVYSYYDDNTLTIKLFLNT